MTEKELYSAFAEKRGIKESEATEIVRALTDLITSTLETEDKVTFGKLGTFEKKEVAARAGREVSAEKSMHGKAYTIEAKPARTKIGFKLSKAGKKIGA